MFKVYKLTFSSGKSYIGQTSRKMITRITQHRQSARIGSLLAVHCAWRAYGEPDVMLLAEVDSQEELHAAEIAAIASFNTMSPYGYNLSIGGDTAPSKNSDVALKIARKAVGRRATKEVKARIGNASKSNWENDAYRKKVIDAVKAAWTPEMRAARSEKAKAFWAKRKADGWAMPQSHKDNLAKRVISDESRAKMSASAKGKPKAPRSAEANAKIAERTKAAWSNPEITAKRTASIRAAWTPEKKAEMAAKAAELWKNPEIRAKRLEAMRKAKTEK